MSLAAVASLSWTPASEASVWDSVVLACLSVASSCDSVPRALAIVGVRPDTIPVRSPDTTERKSRARWKPRQRILTKIRLSLANVGRAGLNCSIDSVAGARNGRSVIRNSTRLCREIVLDGLEAFVLSSKRIDASTR